MGNTKLTRILTSFYLVFVISVSSMAGEWVESYNNARTLAMGGAMIGITSDETSLYRNPANLGSVRSYFGALIDPEIEGQQNFTDIVTSSNLTTAADLEKMAQTLSANPNQYYHAKLQFTPSFTTRNFGFGVIYRNELNGLVDATGSTMDTLYQNDFGAVLGVNQSLFGGVIKVGASARALNRIEVVSSTVSVSGTIDLKSIATEGSAVAYDAGIMIQIPVAWVPTLSAVVRDIGNTKFDKKDGVRLRGIGTPNEVKQSIDAAISFFPIHANKIRSTWTVEYRDITDSREEESTTKRLHIGAEVNLKDLFFIRFGMNQGYYTGGFELSSEKFAWQLATYGEEVGTEDNKVEDRRYSTRILFRY